MREFIYLIMVLQVTMFIVGILQIKDNSVIVGIFNCSLSLVFFIVNIIILIRL